MELTTHDVRQRRQREYETDQLASCLTELYTLTNVTAKRNPLSLTEFLKKHALCQHSKAILDLGIVTQSASDPGTARQGQKSYIWTSQYRVTDRDAAEHIAALVYNKTEDIKRVDKLNKREDQKFNDLVKKGNLKRLDQVNLKAIGTVHAFMKDVFVLTKTGATIHQLNHITGPADAPDHVVKTLIVEALKGLTINTQNGHTFTWFESEPDVDFARMVAEDILNGRNKQTEPVESTEEERPKNNRRSERLRNDIQQLLASIQKTPSTVNPTKSLKHGNLKSVINRKKVFTKIDNKWFLINEKTIEQLADEIYNDLQKYQEKYLNKPNKKETPKEQPIVKLEKEKKEERQPRKRGNDVGDLFVLRADAIAAAKAYKTKLHSLGMEDHKFMEEIKKF